MTHLSSFMADIPSKLDDTQVRNLRLFIEGLLYQSCCLRWDRKQIVSFDSFVHFGIALGDGTL